MRQRYYLYLLLLFIFLTPFFMKLLWVIQKERPLSIFVYDKTVLNNNCVEHQCFYWILNQYKFTKNDNELYDYKKDYFGLFPKDNFKYEIKDLNHFKAKQIDSIVDKYDVLFLSDNYGIYEEEWTKKQIDNNKSSLIYGGLSKNDVLFIKKMINKGNLVIGEHNLFGSPTKTKETKETENLFGLEWTGWNGRYFEKLDTTNNPDLPKWVVKKYMEQNNNGWNFKKGGIIYINVNGKIVILDKNCLKTRLPIIVSSKKMMEQYNVPEQLKYVYWFEINKNISNPEILAELYVNTNEKGDSILNKNGIPKYFPIIFKNYNESIKTYYIAADFSDNKVKTSFSKMKGIKTFKYFFKSINNHSDPRNLFWYYYEPFISRILLDYSN